MMLSPPSLLTKVSNKIQQTVKIMFNHIIKKNHLNAKIS